MKTYRDIEHLTAGIYPNRHKWILVSEKNPRFNIWECQINNGNHYREAFDNIMNPNIVDFIKECSMKDKHDIVRKLYDAGLDNHEIAKITGVLYGTVCDWITAIRGIDSGRKQVDEEYYLTAEQKESIIEQKRQASLALRAKMKKLKQSAVVKEDAK